MNRDSDLDDRDASPAQVVEPTTEPRLARGTSGLREAIERRGVELRSLIVETVETLALADQDRIRLRAPDPILADIDAGRISRVVAHLVDAALRGSACGEVVIGLEQHPGAAAIWVGHLGSPTVPAAEIHQIVEGHGGRLHHDDVAEQHCRWFVELPLGPAQRQPRLAGQSGLVVGAPHHVAELIPLLDDEGMVLHRARSAAEALDALREHTVVVVEAELAGAEALIPELRARATALIVVVSRRRAAAQPEIVVVSPSDAGELFAVIVRHLGRDLRR
ncbi:MAG: hypothetical protein WKG01_04520 [Kofleriaceae bacterium]